MLAQDEADTISPGSYHRLIAEHHLRRAEEYLLMARYQAARKALARVLAVAPDYRGASILEKRIEDAVRAIHWLKENGASQENGHPVKNGKNNGHRARQSKIVLTVDQDEQVLTVLAESLHKYGFGALGAGSYTEAMEVLKSVKPDLIVSEVNFENGPMGFELFSLVRNNEELRDIPFLYIATRVNREMLIAGKRLGVEDIILKPLDAEVVMASIIRSISRKK